MKVTGWYIKIKNKKIKTVSKKGTSMNSDTQHAPEFLVSEAVAQRFSVKKVFLEISQNS